MHLAVDIGNTSIKFGLFDRDKLTSKFSIPTKRDSTADELRSAVGDRLRSPFDKAVVCSVVPEMEKAMTAFLGGETGTDPLVVNNSFDFGLKVNYEPLDSLGTDRLVTAFAAVEKYGVPVIVCSLGTATTIDVISADREFLGGVIAPGLDAMAEALHRKAPRLPRVENAGPRELLGNTTEDAIRSGIYNGYIAMVKGLILQFMGTFEEDAFVVATGGYSSMLIEEMNLVQAVDENLLLEGLCLLSKTPNTH